ncbi:DinB family protein [Alicyclobacillus kakegawensis]|uniref:DinB family protein n=1 Tax=Alicyclobacillus kakegawensis TaxID=392012 RepID=UPI000832B638|nr:DinB family protein [Alicyclobacillus kakegawensis]
MGYNGSSDHRKEDGRNTAACIHLAVWLSAMSGAIETIQMSVPLWQAEVKDATLETFETCFAKTAARYESFLASHPDLEAVSEYTHPTYGTLRARYTDIVQHVVNHGTYHRDNITAMLRQLGYPGASTDYVFYLYRLQR